MVNATLFYHIVYIEGKKMRTPTKDRENKRNKTRTQHFKIGPFSHFNMHND